MAIDITHINAARPRQQASQSDQAEQSGRQNAATQSTRDEVEISNAALSARELENAVHDAPSFDEQRVNEIAAAIRDGNYPVNPERIALKFLELEAQL